MIRTLYEIVTPEEFVLIGRQSLDGDEETQKLAHEVLLQYQFWQRGLLNEETQQKFEEAVKAWKERTE